MASDCSCGKCVSACNFKPGWFKPGQVEKVADFLGMPLEKLFEEKLGVDYYEADDPIFVLSPAVNSMTPGSEFPYDPRGRCVFLKDGKCEIHPVKPFECREMIHGQPASDRDGRHQSVAKSWDNQESKNQIEKLLGRSPVEATGSFYNLF